MDVAGCISGLRVRLVFFISDIEGYIEKICYCFIGVGSYLEVEFLKFFAECFLNSLCFLQTFVVKLCMNTGIVPVHDLRVCNSTNNVVLVDEKKL